MSQTVAPGAPYTSRLVAGRANTGLVGTVRFRLLDNDATADDPIYGPSTANIIEDPTGSGVYVFDAGVAPTTRGNYARIWDTGPDTELIPDEDLLVSYTAAAPDEPGGRDLCTLVDVTSYLPGYKADDPDNAGTNEKLQALITSQSQLIMLERGREIVAAGSQPATRHFLIDNRQAWRRIVDVGDLSTAEGITVRLLAWDRTLSATITAESTIGLYGDREYQLEDWEPVTRLSFPLFLGGPIIIPGQWLEVTGTFGFPEIPAFVKEACAGRVILRYLSDVAQAGTALTDALQNVNLAGIFQASEDALHELDEVVYA